MSPLPSVPRLQGVRLELLDAAARSRCPHVRARPPARHRIDVVLPQPHALRFPRRMDPDPGAAAGRPAQGPCRSRGPRAAHPVGARRPVRPGDRRRGPQARLRADARVRQPVAAEPHRRRGGSSARRRPGRAHPRSRGRDRPEAVLRADVRAFRRRGCEAGDEAPDDGADLLRRRRPRQPDLRLLDPHPSARAIGYATAAISRSRKPSAC